MSMVYTYDGTNSSVNLTPASAAECMLRFKQTMLQAGWTVVSSNNGTTASAADNVTTAAHFGTNNMWVVLRQHSNVAGSRQLCLFRGTVNTSWKLSYSYSAGFTGGTTSAKPTASDEQYLVGSAAAYGVIFGTDGTYRFSVSAENTDSLAFYAFWFTTGGSAPVGMIVADLMVAATATGDNDPYIFYSPWGAALPANVGLFSSNTSGLTSEATAGQGCWSWYKKGLSGEAWVGYSALIFSNASANVIPTLLGPNPISNKDEAFPMFFARRSALTQPGFKGLGTILKWNGANRNTGDTLSIASSNAKDRIVVGHVNLPWNGSTPAV